MRGGLLPAALTEGSQKRRPGSPDATLWLFQAASELAARVGLDDELVRGPLYSALTRAFLRMRRFKNGSIVWVTDDGLLATVAGGDPSTWMDARVAGRAATPRRGAAVEHQALWFRNCRELAQWARHYGHSALAEAAAEAQAALFRGFAQQFWCNETDYPFDTVGVEPGAGADASIRPNALVALAVAPELFEPWQADSILARVRSDLLTPRGLRTLAPSERAFQGHYEGTLDEREAALHQGTVWPFLLRYWVRAMREQRPDDEELRAELEDVVIAACENGPVLGHIAQIADGEEPHRIRGCPAQAWSTASLLHALMVDLDSG
jgi:glycogen debranching enzyme